MAALAKEQQFTEIGDSGWNASYKVLNAVKIYAGAMVGITAAGYAQAFATGNFFAGHALETVDNTNGAAGAVRIRVRSGSYRFKVPVFASAAIANIGDSVWGATDNHADLTLTDPTGGPTTTDRKGTVAGIDDAGNVIITAAVGTANKF